MNYVSIAYFLFFISLFVMGESKATEMNAEGVNQVSKSQIECFKELDSLIPEQNTIHSFDGMYYFPTWNPPGEADTENSGVENQKRVLVVFDEQTIEPYYYVLDKFNDIFGYTQYYGKLRRPVSSEIYDYEVNYSFLLDGHGKMKKSRNEENSEVETALFVSESQEFERSILNYRFQEKLNDMMRIVRWKACDADEALTFLEVKSSKVIKSCQVYPWSRLKQGALKRLSKFVKEGCPKPKSQN